MSSIIALAHQLAVLAAGEKSKTAFYVAGGLLVAWAVVVSVGVGLRRSSFPSNLGGQWGIITVSLVLVAAAMASAVITASKPAKAQAPPPSPPAGAVAPGNRLSIAADPTGLLQFTKSRLVASAGALRIAFTNSSPLSHNFTIVGGNGKVLGATPTFDGGSQTVSVDLRPGTYAFMCTVAGHAAAGMHGTLVVA